VSLPSFTGFFVLFRLLTSFGVPQEVLNRRLFSTVREKKRLTYDANFHLTGFERIQGGWYLVTVTAKPEQAQKALDACKETLQAARTWDPITRDNLQSAVCVCLCVCALRL